MKRTLKWTVLAVAITAATAASAESEGPTPTVTENTAINTNIDTDIDTNIVTNLTTNKTYTSDVNKDVDLVYSDTYTSDVNKDVDLVYSDTFDRTTTANHAIDTSYTDSVDKSYNSDVNKSVDLSYSDAFDRTTTANHAIDTSYTDTVDKSFTSDVSYSDSFERNSTANHAIDTSYTDTVDKSLTSDISYTDTVDKSFTSDVSYSDSFERTSTATHDVATTYNDNFDKNTSINTEVNKEFNASTNIEYNWQRNFVDTDIDHNEVVFVDHDITIDKEVDEHGVSAELESDLSLTSDIDITGNPTVSGDLVIDSAAIAVIDNRQANGGNVGINDELSNEASISEDTAGEASGNLQFNVAAGDNNQQDNAAALSAADASFAFGLADSKVFVQQTGAGNQTSNLGVTNAASIGDNAFTAATGNIGVNVTSGNNNQQKNSLAASVATAGYASAAASTNQVSAGNTVTNAPKVEEGLEQVAISLTGSVVGSLGLGGATGSYSGSSSGTYEGTGNAYQAANVYLDTWSGNTHTGGNQTGHIDIDGAIQGATNNPYRGSDEFGPIGGLAFDTDEEGSWTTTESGAITFEELGAAELTASLSGVLAVPTLETVSEATNSATLSGAAFQNASGNIGVNVSAGTGNQQSNSLSLAVAQPGAGGPGG